MADKAHTEAVDEPHPSGLPPVRPIPALDASGDLATALLAALTDVAVQVFDAELRIILLAGGALRRHGFDNKVLFGRRIDEILPEPMLEVMKPQLGIALSGEHVQYDYVAFDGVSCFELTAGPLRDLDNTIIGVVQLVRDVTAHHAAESALHAAQARTRAAFYEAPVAMALCTTSGRWSEVNLEFARLLKRTPAELVGTHLLDITHPDDIQTSTDFFAGTLAGLAAPGRWLDKRYLAGDGTEVPVRVAVATISGSGGEIDYLVVHVLER